MGLQETRRDGQSVFSAAGFTVFCSGDTSGVKGRAGQHGVGIAVKESILAEMGGKGATVEYISARLMKMKLELHGKSNAVSFVVGYAPTETAPPREKDKFWNDISDTISQVPGKEHLVVMMDANARTGKRGEGGGEKNSKVIGEYGQDVLNNNGERLLTFAEEQRLAVLNTFFRTPKRGISYTFQSSNAGKGRYRLDYILTRQTDRKLVRNISVRRPPPGKRESDHNLVYGQIRLRGRFAPNRRMRTHAPTRRTADLERLMANPELRAMTAQAASPLNPLPTDATATAMAADLSTMLISAAANTAPRERKQHGSHGWCASAEAKAEIHTAWMARESARRASMSAPTDANLRKALKMTNNELRRVRTHAVERFFETYVSRLEEHIADGDQRGFYRHLKGIDVEGKNHVAHSSSISETTRVPCSET